MDIVYDRKINKTDIILISNNEADKADDYVERMLLENSISSFLKLISSELSEKKCVYDVTSYVSIEEYVINSKIDCEIVLLLIQAIISAGNAVNEYLIPYENVFFNMLFLDKESKNIKFIVYPYENNGGLESLKSIADILIENVDYSDEKASFIAYEFYNMVNNKDYEFESLLRNFNKNSDDTKNEQNIEYNNDNKIAEIQREEKGINEELTDTICAIESKNTEKRFRGIAIVCSIAILLCLAIMRAF